MTDIVGTQPAMTSLGFLGTSADPVQRAHPNLAETVRIALQIDKMAIIPAFRPPHKPSRKLASNMHRYAMCVLATMKFPNLLVSDMEFSSPDEPYTYQTASRLREQHNLPTCYCVIGADLLPTLHTWKEPKKLLCENNLVAMSRPGFPLNLPDLPLTDWGVRICDVRGRQETGKPLVLEASELNHSGGGIIYLMDCLQQHCASSEIRKQLRAGTFIDYAALDPDVFEYIRKYDIYPPGSED